MAARLDSLQFALFVPGPPPSGLATWMRVFMVDPEGLAPMAPVGQQISAKVDGLQIHLQVQPGRLDLIVAPPEHSDPAEPPVLEDPAAALALGCKYAAALLQEGYAAKVAIVANTHESYETPEEATAALAAAVPSLPIPPGGTDIQYHCSKRLKGREKGGRSLYGIFRWFVGARALIFVDMSRMTQGPLVARSQPIVGRYIDVASLDGEPVLAGDIARVLASISEVVLESIARGYEYILD